MATLSELGRLGTDLNSRHLVHLQRLLSWWGLLSDICFSDLLLFAPLAGGSKFVVADQIRPATAKTLYREDHIGQVVDEVARPLVARSYRLGEVVEGEVPLDTVGTRARVRCIPVRHDDHVVAVLSREVEPNPTRLHGELERTYLAIFDELARMIADGQFPFRTEEIDPEDLPRVGDGAVVVDTDGRIGFTSPNALSTLHRIGVPGVVDGLRLSEIGLEQHVVRNALRNAVPTIGEVEGASDRGDVTVQLVAVPLIRRLAVTGALVLMRDVTELRRRDRLLMSKDATIREIHHRVKNNLQTISSLLRLQGRRLASPEAKAVIEESVRRIHAIAVVHETLSHDVGEDIDLLDVAEQIARTVEESLTSPDRPVRFVLSGDVGIVPSAVVTPLAVVLNELLQNTVDHAFEHRPIRDDGFMGRVDIGVARTGDSLRLTVADDGNGLPPGFSPSDTDGLGVSIVTALVTSELSGTLDYLPREGGGTEVVVEVPIDAGAARE